MTDIDDEIRDLIAEGRKHDEAMTKTPWLVSDQPEFVVSAVRDRVGETYGAKNDVPNVAGISWMRTNLRAMLDALERLRADVEYRDRVLASAALDAAERNSDIERLSTEVERLETREKILVQKLDNVENGPVVKQVGFVPTSADYITLGRIHDAAPPIHVGDLAQRMVKRILAASCPVHSNECAIRGVCTNKCGILNPGVANAEASAQSDKQPAVQGEPDDYVKQLHDHIRREHRLTITLDIEAIEGLIEARRCVERHCDADDKYHAKALRELDRILGHLGGQR